jgi:hypothetical protein
MDVFILMKALRNSRVYAGVLKNNDKKQGVANISLKIDMSWHACC